MTTVWMIELQKRPGIAPVFGILLVKEDDRLRVREILEAKGWHCVERPRLLTTPEAAADMYSASDYE